jgi:CDGSH-type Zn-finger protein
MTSSQINPPSKPKIKVTKNGSYLAIGNLPLSEQEITLDAQNVPIGWTQHTQHVPKQTCALCRCGQTSKKPFCDGTHTKINFDGTETAEKELYLANPTLIEGPALTLVDVEALCASARFCHRAGGIWNLVPQSGDSTAKRMSSWSPGLMLKSFRAWAGMTICPRSPTFTVPYMVGFLVSPINTLIQYFILI